MYKAKTVPNDHNVKTFIEGIDHPQKKEDAYRLLEIFSEESGYEAIMWGDSLIGFGSYHYKYDSGHEGKTMLVGFSPRKAKISLYFATGDTKRGVLLEKLGKHTSGKACVYINKVSDIDTNVLRELIRESLLFLKEKYGPDED